MTLAKAMATVGGLTLVSRIAGFARDLVMSHTLGAGPVADAFFVALKFPNFFRSITAEGAFSISFVPLYSDKIIKDGQESATRFASAALSFMIAVLLPFSVIVMWLMPYVMVALAPGFVPHTATFDMAVDMARLSFPYLGLVSVAALLGAVLNAHSKFGPYAFAPVLFSLCLIAAVVFTPLFPTQGHAMAAAMSISGALQAAWVWFYIRRMGLKIRLTWPRLDDDLKALFKLMGPGVLVAGAFQINLFMNLMIGSLLPHGAISYLYYADRLYQLPFGVIGIAVGTALLPLFSQALARDDRTETHNLYNRSLEYMLLLCLPCAFGLLLAADPLIRTIYLHGAFKLADVQGTVLVLMAYAIGLPAYVISRVYNAVFYAHKDTWSPVKMTLITTAINVPLSFAMSYPLGAMGIALSTALVGWLQIYLLHARVRKEGLDLAIDDRLKRALPRIFLSTGLLIIAVIMMRYGLHDAFAGAFWGRIPALLALIAVSIIVYFSAIFMTNALPFADLKRYLTRKKGRKDDHDLPATE